MAYQVPPQWQHGDIPIAAQMNKYVDAINAMHAAMSTLRRFRNTAFYMEPDNARVSFIHRLPYLWYRDGATLYDPYDSENNSESLPKNDGGWQRFDLSKVGWLYVGKLYVVYDADACVEHWW